MKQSAMKFAVGHRIVAFLLLIFILNMTVSVIRYPAPLAVPTDLLALTDYSAAGTPPIEWKTTAQRCPVRELDTLKGLLKSQDQEDRHLLEWFNGLCNGTYVELGALDGKSYSNSHVFSKAFAWKGLMVEVSPRSFDMLQGNRPNELALVHAAVCNTEDEERTMHFYQPNPRHKAGVSGIWELTSAKFRDRWWPGVTLKDTTAVSCRSLRHIMEHELEGDTYYFDFLSLDCEGCELTALQSIDWDRTAFGIIFVEAESNVVAVNAMLNSVVQTYVQEQGYLYQGRIARSDWFIHPRFHAIYQHLLQ